MQSVLEVFEAIHQAGLKYCHWKSNSHLKESFNGDTDFDLLIAREDASAFQRILLNAGFKRRLGTANKVYPGMEDFIGFEVASGKIHHFHLHYNLIMGKKYRKNYVLPFSEEVLKTAMDHERFPLKVVRPELELLILITRVCLKTDMTPKNQVKLFLGKKVFPKNIYAEFDYLINKIDEKVFEQYSVEYFGEKSPCMDFVKSFRSGNLLKDFRSLRKRIYQSIKNFTRYAEGEVDTQYRLKLLSSKSSKTWVSGGGIILSFIGCDGAGKSTTVSTVKEWLSGKLSVKHHYMGLPRQQPINRLLTTLITFSGKLGIKKLKKEFKAIRRVFIARHKYHLYLKATQLKNQGYVVIFDRYPLKDFWEMKNPMDGPRLPENTYWGKREREYLLKVKFPENLFVLYVTEEESVKRKAHHSTEENRKMIHEKVTAIETLIERRGEEFTVINTVQKQEDVILDVKNQIWKIL